METGGFFALLVPAAGVGTDVAPAGVLGAYQFLVWYLITAGSVASQLAAGDARLRSCRGAWATMRSLNWGMVALGATAGGVLGERDRAAGDAGVAAVWMIGSVWVDGFTAVEGAGEIPEAEEEGDKGAPL